MNKILPELKYEIGATFVLLLIAAFLLPSLGLEKNTIYLAEIIIGISAITLAVIKSYLYQQKQDFNKTVDELIDRFTDGPKLASSIIHQMAAMPASNVQYAKKVLNKASEEIDNIEHGIIKLSESEYYDRIMDACREHRKGYEMQSVNTFDETRFSVDPRQKIYFEENIKAISEREATIERIFVFDDKEEASAKRNNKLKAIKANHDGGINIFVVKKSILLGTNQLIVDWVMFSNTATELYVDYQDQADLTRVDHGELRNSESDIEEFNTKFKKLKRMAISDSELKALFDSIT